MTAIAPRRTRVVNSFAAKPQRAGRDEPVTFIEDIRSDTAFASRRREQERRRQLGQQAKIVPHALPSRVGMPTVHAIILAKNGSGRMVLDHLHATRRRDGAAEGEPAPRVNLRT